MKILKYSLLLFLSAFYSSCGENLTELNIDPNTSPSARPQEVLTSGMGYYGIALEGYFNEANALLAQYWAGGPGVALLDTERYFIEPGDFNTEWSFSYLQALSDLDFVLENGNDVRKGMAQVLSACIYQNLVDHYGAIPFSDALKGSLEDGSILTPMYDSDQEVYGNLITLIDQGIANLDGEGEAGVEDLIYAGDVTNWKKFANSLKLRILMRQSITNPAGVAADVVALVAEANFITSESELARIPFNGEVGNWNPQFARREQGIGQFYVASNSAVKVMEDLNDPRLGVLYDVAVNTGTIVGLDQGNVQDVVSPSKDDYSFPSAVCYGADKDVLLVSHWEVMFLRAEADMRFGTADDETVMFNAAVTAHFDYIGLSGAADYLSTDLIYDSGANEASKSRIIGVQKWISFNGLQESEGWIESRRFDTPSDRVFTDNSTGIFQTPTRTVLGAGVFPSIRLYPQSELSFNPNAPSGRTLTDRVFWDN